ncbi:MAG: MFS transporter [Alphaproteobacteria bacterium]|nr:MFS transporter [Alphaproteobacteria bacterium]MBV9419128.1 MFS transporter [Alphaproteobacteria bacterium]MBV9541744.1 MFS transporter [Alphaproteobacteria bacterium]
MDTSSELVHSVLPLFLAGTLGLSMGVIGGLEGAAEATAQFAKLFSGYLSDRMERRKPWILFGYGLAAATKPLFPLAHGVALVAAARFIDRIGKGIRGAPRDALLASVTPPEQRGAAFGLRQSLDTVGAVCGPLAAAGLLILYAGNMRAVLWWAVVPAVLCVLTIILLLREPDAPVAIESKPRLSLRDAARLPGSFWLTVAAASVLTLARFSEAFLILRGTNVGLTLAAAPMVLVAMNVVYTLSSYPAGALSDRLGRKGLLVAGTATLIAADAALAIGSLPAFAAGVALWGLHMGLTQGLLSAMIADAAPAQQRGTAFGAYNAVTGVALLLSSTLAGLLWDRFGAGTTFIAGAAISLVALVLIAARPQPR